VKQFSLSKKLLVSGGVLVFVLNPLSLNILADVLVTSIDWATVQLVFISNYVVVFGMALLFTGFLVQYEYNRTKSIKKLKSLKNKNTESAGKYIDS